MNSFFLVSFLSLVWLRESCGFAPSSTSSLRPAFPTHLSASNKNSGGGGVFQGFKDFFEELDNFIDDASARRLGNGAAFYGKRKSNFYGSNDKNRKADSSRPDPREDYQAPSEGGYFQWTPDENGQMRPVTRMKKKIVERNLSYWDKVYSDEEKE